MSVLEFFKITPKDFVSDLKLTFVKNRMNLILLCLLPIIVLGLVAHNVGWSAEATFSLNFVGIVPLAGFLCFATEELAEKLGDTIGGLLNASFGNAVELIIAIIALQKNEITVVQYSMLGSIISNCLLVLGCCFFAGSYNAKIQTINEQGASALSSLLLICAITFSLPTIHYLRFGHNSTTSHTVDSDHIKVSDACAILLFLIYLGFLYFQLVSHKSLFEVQDDDESTQVPVDEEASLGTTEESGEPKEAPALIVPATSADATNVPVPVVSTRTKNGTIRHATNKSSVIAAGLPTKEHVTPIFAIFLLTITTVVVAFAAEYMVDSIGEIAERDGISTAFIAMILIPIAGNVVEHVTSVAVSLKGKMDLAVSVAVGSALQIALFVYPVLVFISWGLGNGLTFVFNAFDISVLTATALLVFALISDGKTHYLEGAMLIIAYVIVAVCYYFTPNAGYDI